MKRVIAAMSLIALCCALGIAAQSSPPVNPAAATTEEDAAVAAEREQRAALRAFYTAPPVIPHETNSLRNRDCQICHQEIRDLADRTSLVTPHINKYNCMQCHMASMPPFGEEAKPVESTFRGLAAPVDGDRAHPLAPPTIPHRVFMREKCTACHSPESPYVSLRSPHAERYNCKQCHVADGATEFEIQEAITAQP